MAKYKKKPIEIDAFLWTRTPDQEPDPEWLTKAIAKGEQEVGGIWFTYEHLYIMTLEGAMKANPGDYIIQGIQGELYPCKPNIFKETYDKVCE